MQPDMNYGKAHLVGAYVMFASALYGIGSFIMDIGGLFL